MDSNTINFVMLPSTHPTSTSSPLMVDQSASLKPKSPTDESTNFIEYQRFKKVTSSSKSKEEQESDFQSKNTFLNTKTKLIQKPNKMLKESQKQLKNQNISNFNSVSSRTFLNQNSELNKNKKDVLKKPTLIKSHSFVSIFDWMMQIAAIMKLNRSVFYRACNIFYETYKKDPKILENSNVEKYACGCLLISAKLQKANLDMKYLEDIYQINKKRMSKQLILSIEISIYQTLNWKLPLYSLVSEEVLNVFTKWNQYLEKQEKMGKIRKDTRQRLTINLKYSQNQPLKNKTYGEILYLLDILVFNQTKKYLNTQSIEDNKPLFTTPILIAMYSVFTIQLGDTQNRQRFYLSLFKNFYKLELEMSAIEIDRLPKQIQISFMLFNFAQHLSKIPLNKDWKEVVQDDLQTYLPVKVIKRTDIK